VRRYPGARSGRFSFLPQALASRRGSLLARASRSSAAATFAHHPPLLRASPPSNDALDRQREEIEADVLVEQRIVPAVRRLVDEPEDEIPLAHLANGDEQSEDERDGEDEQTP
jgi:hypothetical protein